MAHFARSTFGGTSLSELCEKSMSVRSFMAKISLGIPAVFI